MKTPEKEEVSFAEAGYSASNMIRKLLDGVREMTSSRYACYAHVDRAGKKVLSFEACSETLADCSIDEASGLIGVSESGIFESVIHSGSPLLINDPDDPRLESVDFPDWHIEIKRLLVVPATIRDGVVRALLMVSGKPDEYTDRNVEHIRILVSGVHSILELKRIEKERDSMREMVVQTQKLEAIGTLAGGIAHDFNNQLVAIRGFAELTMMDMEETDFRYQNLVQIAEAADHSAALTRQLLLFSKRDRIEIEPVDTNELIKKLHKMLVRIIGEDIEIKTCYAKDPWIIQADPGNIEQLVMNLSVNAKEAMPKGGSLSIETANVTVNEKEAGSNPNASEGEFLRITVSDCGDGMSKDVMSHIFDPFFSTKPAGSGLGLGLSVVYGIVAQYDGWMTVESEPGNGTCFKIYFPVFMHEAVDEVAEKTRNENLRGSGERILLVDDDYGVLSLANKMLSRNEYVVYTAESAEKASGIFEKEKGRFDLLLTDIVLPGKSGVDLAADLLSQTPELKILLMSGYPTRKILFGDLREKGFRFLKKPFSFEGLLGTVRKTIAE